MNKIIITRIAAIGGTRIEAVETATAVPVSIVDITGLAIPPVVVLEVTLPTAFAPFMAVAVPPPAIMAKDHVMTGSKFATVEAITAVPAIAARGTARLSNALSTQGMKYAKISIIIATPNMINAVKLPIHSQLSLSSQTPRYAAKLKAKSGRNTLKPTEAARPIPKNMLMIVSGDIPMVWTKVGYS